MNERLDELRKFITEKADTDETEEGTTQLESAPLSEKDAKKLHKLLAQIKQCKIQTREARRMVAENPEFVLSQDNGQSAQKFKC